MDFKHWGQHGQMGSRAKTLLGALVCERAYTCIHICVCNSQLFTETEGVMLRKGIARDTGGGRNRESVLSPCQEDQS